MPVRIPGCVDHSRKWSKPKSILTAMLIKADINSKCVIRTWKSPHLSQPLDLEISTQVWVLHRYMLQIRARKKGIYNNYNHNAQSLIWEAVCFRLFTWFFFHVTYRCHQSEPHSQNCQWRLEKSLLKLKIKSSEMKSKILCFFCF